VDLTHQQLCREDTLVICSDGLSGLVRREEIASLATRHTDMAVLCGALIDSANARGGPDNITVIAAHFDGEGLPEATDAADPGYQVFPLPDQATPTEPVLAVQPPVPAPVPVPPRRSLSPFASAALIFLLLAAVALVIALVR
jgi:protein phosphatase